MNKFTLALGLMLASVFFFNSSRSSHSNSGGAPAARTGAPKATSGNEATCSASGCHSGTVNAGPHSVTISLDGDPETLMPGEQYDVTVSIPGSTATAAGFQMVCLNAAKANCGAIIPTSGSNKLVSGTGRSYVTHSNKNNKSWSFKWTAPATLTDSVFFYAAGREESGGSKTYTTRRKFINNLTSTESDFANEAFSLYPTLTDGRIFVKTNGLFSPMGQIRVLDNKGQIVCSRSLGELNSTAGDGMEIELPAEANPGIYYCQLVSGSQRVVKKFFKN